MSDQQQPTDEEVRAACDVLERWLRNLPEEKFTLLENPITQLIDRRMRMHREAFDECDCGDTVICADCEEQKRFVVWKKR